MDTLDTRQAVAAHVHVHLYMDMALELQVTWPRGLHARARHQHTFLDSMTDECGSICAQTKFIPCTDQYAHSLCLSSTDLLTKNEQ